MTEEQLKEIEERAGAATPGPWVWAPSIGGGVEVLNQIRPDGTMYEIGPWREDFEPQDAYFIAAARTDVPDLVAEVQKLHSVLTELLDLWNIAAIVPKWTSGSPHPMLCSRVGPAWTAAREALGREG